MIERNEVPYPDAADAKRLWLFRAAVVISVFATLLYMRSQLSSMQDPKQARFVLSVIALTTAIFPLAFWAWTFFVFRRVIQSDQWPYPGARLTRPVAILRGREARKQGWRVLALGSVLVVTCIPASVYLHFGVGARIERLMEPQLQELKSANKLLHATCEDARA